MKPDCIEFVELLNELEDKVVDSPKKNREIGQRIGDFLEKAGFPEKFKSELKDYAEFLPERVRKEYGFD